MHAKHRTRPSYLLSSFVSFYLVSYQSSSKGNLLNRFEGRALLCNAAGFWSNLVHTLPFALTEDVQNIAKHRPCYMLKELCH
jgi:hypothetical protein